MRKVLRIAVTAFVCTAMTFGISSLVSAGRGKPAPPPPVLCGCICPDGSFTTVHAPDANSCESACATACQGSEEM